MKKKEELFQLLEDLAGDAYQLAAILAFNSPIRTEEHDIRLLDILAYDIPNTLEKIKKGVKHEK